MIVSFADDETRRIYHGQTSRKLPPDIQRTARRKLLYLDNARDLRDLWIPPANQLEALKGNRKGQHSIRINDQWRICFTWVVAATGTNQQEQQIVQNRSGDAYDVEIVDYH